MQMIVESRSKALAGFDAVPSASTPQRAMPATEARKPGSTLPAYIRRHLTGWTLRKTLPDRVATYARDSRVQFFI